MKHFGLNVTYTEARILASKFKLKNREIEKPIIGFQQFTITNRKKRNFQLSHTRKVDEFLINFGTVRNQTTNSKGVKIVLVKKLDTKKLN